MSQFVQWSNFSKIAPYAELFRQGIVVRIYGSDRLLHRADTGTDENVQCPSIPGTGP